jgi:membrane-associated phospholipid phosphatase
MMKADQPVLTDLIEEAADISIQYPVHLCAADSDDERRKPPIQKQKCNDARGN